MSEQEQNADNLHDTRYYHDVISGKRDIDGTPISDKVHPFMWVAVGVAWVSALAAVILYYKWM